MLITNDEEEYILPDDTHTSPREEEEGEKVIVITQAPNLTSTSEYIVPETIYSFDDEDTLSSSEIWLDI